MPCGNVRCTHETVCANSKGMVHSVVVDEYTTVSFRTLFVDVLDSVEQHHTREEVGL